MLKLGDKTIGKLYVGDKPIYKAYWGDKLIYQASKPVFLDYVIFDGASWIDTGINKQSCTIECTVKLESTDYRQFLGGWSHIGGYYIAVDTSNRFELGSSAIVTGSNATELSNVVAEHTETEMILTVNGKYAKRTKQVQTEPDKNYWLGNINSTAYSGPIKGQVYGHKFTSPDGVLIQDLRPCIDPKGIVCMYDLVTKKYFYNSGTGTLTAGNKINFVDYIETDGNSYIDTGIILGINHKVSVKVNTPTSSSSAIQLFGNYSDSAGYFTCNIANSIGAISRFDGATYTGNISRSDGNFHTYSLDKNGILIDLDTILNWNKTPTDFQQSDSFYLFRARGSSSVTPNGTKISEEKVWENDTLVQHLKPCVVAGEACFYDMATGKVFTNAGTGTLSYTE